MKTGIIFDIKKFAIHDGPGIRTTVFLKGCPLNCQWCHNPESRLLKPETIQVKINRNNGKPAAAKDEQFGYEATVSEVIKEIKKDDIFYDQSGGGVTFSGGEPMHQIDFLTELLKECRKNYIHTCVDTTGYAPFEHYEKIYEYTDIFLYDLKHMDDDEHKKYTSVSNELILDNLTRLANKGEKVWLRLPMIPGLTDTEKNLKAVAEFIKPLENIKRISLLPYNMLGDDKRDKFDIPVIHDELKELSTQPKDELIQKSELFINQGYDVKIGG